MPKRDDHYAILVAIARYPGLGDLAGPENDAADFRAWLLDEAGGNLDESHIAVIRSSDFPPSTNPDDEHPTESEFKKVLNAWCKDEKRQWREECVGARLYLFFAGHGFTASLGDNPALFTGQAQNGDTVHIAGFQYALKIRNAGFFGEIVLVMDCCQDVIVSANVNLPTWDPPDRRAADDVLMMTAFAAPRGKQSREDVSENGSVKGYFSSVFTDALRNAPADKRGNVTAEAVATTALDAWESQGYIQRTGVNHPPITAPRGLALYRREVLGADLCGDVLKSSPQTFEKLWHIDGILGTPDLTGGYPRQEADVFLASATIRAGDDGALIRILDAGRQELASGIGSLHAQLEVGNYIARFRVGDAVRDRLFEVNIGDGQVTIDEGPLEFSSPVPMPGTSTVRGFYYAAAMELRDRAARHAQTARYPGTAGVLIVFARDADHTPGTEWLMPGAIAAGLRLRKLDAETGRPRIVPVEPVVDEERGYSSLLLTDLTPGTYMLGVRRELRDYAFWQEIAVTVAESRWRTEVYIDSINDDRTRRRFDIERAGVLIAPGDRGGSTGVTAAARSAEIARLALLEGRVGVNESTLHRLLHDTTFTEPMLALYTAYAMSMAPAPDVEGVAALCRGLRECWTARSGDVRMLERWCAASGAKSAPADENGFNPDEVPMIARGWRLSRQLGPVGRLAVAAQYYIGMWRTTGALWTQTQVPGEVEAEQMGNGLIVGAAAEAAESKRVRDFAAKLARPSQKLSPLQQTLRRAILDAADADESVSLGEFVKRFEHEAGFDAAVILSAINGLGA